MTNQTTTTSTDFAGIIEQNKDRYLNELKDLLRIQSVSADSKFKKEVQKGAEFVSQKLTDAGVPHVEICPTAGHPIVYGEQIIDKSLPTILVYGHYDVQPADPYELWTSPPFEPVVKNGRIYARGAADDKGQMYMHIKAIEILNNNGGPACNVKFVIEGEEEVGSENLETFVRANQDKLSADMVLVSDTGMLSNENPSITTGLRGLSYMEVEVVGPNKDLHSGMYGGAVVNPINALCEMIAQLKDESGSIAIPGFYDNVEPVSDTEREHMARAPFSEEEFKKELDVDAVAGEEGYTTLERKSVRPTLDVNGIWGGYTGEGSKTVLPSKANAKISMRLVPGQSSKEISDLFKKHFLAIAPKGVRVSVSYHHGGEPAVTPIDSPAYKAAEKAFQKAWDKTPIPLREGGSIPIVAMFERVLGIKSLLMGFGLGADAIHSPDESYMLFNYFKGIETIALFHGYYTKEMGHKVN